MNILELLKRSDKKKSQRHQRLAKETPWYRAGTGGIYLADEGVYAGCPRKALLRRLGIDLGVEEDKHTMFMLGRTQEEEAKIQLIKELGEEYTVTGDDVNSTAWNTLSGTPVTGSPDIIVLENKTGERIAIEVKTCCSVWTSLSVFYKNMPKFSHLVQSCHYMMGLGLADYKLLYIQPVNFWLPGYGIAEGLLPQPGQTGSEQIAWSTDDNGKLKISKKGLPYPLQLLPGRVVYDLTIREDKRLHFRKEGSEEEWQRTPITFSAIIDYYNELDETFLAGKLPDRPITIDSLGYDLGAGKSECKYCGNAGQCNSLRGVCDLYESDLDSWVKALQELEAKNS